MTDNEPRQRAASRRALLWRAAVAATLVSLVLVAAWWLARRHFALEGPTCSENAIAVSSDGRFETRSEPVPISPSPGARVCQVWVGQRYGGEAPSDYPVPTKVVESWSETVESIRWLDDRTFIANMARWPRPSKSPLSYGFARLTNSPRGRVEHRCELFLVASELPSSLTGEARVKKTREIELTGGAGTVICSKE